ncbi:hypothetical protein [Streptomyces syringium]|uniref:hypothetical protein n=1 Tax=Streptomyces syringium TaxID=76729 RepID=UPI0033EC17EF
MSAKILPKNVEPRLASYYLLLIVEDPNGETTYIDHYLDYEPDDVREFIPEGWDLLEDKSREIIRGAHDCECCGMHIMNAHECESCRNDDCDPANSWHCFTSYCDGSGCTFEGECEPAHEVRVWNEVAELLGHWVVEAEASGRVRVTQREGYEKDADSVFTSLWSAWQYAQGCAEFHAQVLRDECECGEDNCGVLHEHGIFIQEVTENRDLARA